MRTDSRVLLYIVVCFLVLAAGCSRAPVQSNEVIAVQSVEIPLDPAAAAWRNLPEHAAQLLLQDLVEPRLMEASTTQVLVRALTNGTEMAFRLEWLDPSQDDVPGPGRFIDSCAVQVPSIIMPEPPAPQMGQSGGEVQISYWRSDWQAIVDGRGDTLRDLYPDASIDHYPFEAPSLEPGSAAKAEMTSRYSPARALGNHRGGSRHTAVEDLIAEGPGTLTPAPAANSRGQGTRTPDGWAVVISRPVPSGLVPGQRTQVAFAVWEGSSGEVGARKMRSGWIPLLMEAQQ